MLPQCAAWLRIHSGTPEAIMDEVRSVGSPTVALSQFEKAVLCAGFVLGVSEMLTAPFACIPSSVPNEQLVQAVVDFANRQPETMKDDFGRSEQLCRWRGLARKRNDHECISGLHTGSKKGERKVAP